MASHFFLRLKSTSVGVREPLLKRRCLLLTIEVSILRPSRYNARLS